MKLALDQRIRQRAGNVCEYCRLPQAFHPLRFEADHIVAQQHRGPTDFDNLALACPRCNRSKGPNLAGIDPFTGQLVRLFHPRTDSWDDHFEWNDPHAVGRTDVGRATIDVLKINHPDSIKLRAYLIAEKSLPPADEQ